MNVLFDERWIGPHGIGRFAEQVRARISGMEALGTHMSPLHPLAPLALTWTIERRRPAVFFTPGFNAPLFESVPLVLTVHDLNYVLFAENSDPLRRAYFRHLVRPACRRAARVLTVSEYSRQQIIEWAGVSAEAVVNVGCGVDERFRPDGPRHVIGAPYLFVVGNERPHKNTEGLLRAFAHSGVNADVKLLISGRLSRRAIELIDELRLRTSVELVGYIDDDELPSVYRGAVGLCMCSYFEGFGLPVLEAMACGIPVLTSNRTSLPEVAGDAAILTEPASIDAMASGLIRLVNDHSLRTQLVARGLARSRQFSWDETARQIRTVLTTAASCR